MYIVVIVFSDVFIVLQSHNGELKCNICSNAHVMSLCLMYLGWNFSHPGGEFDGSSNNDVTPLMKLNALGNIFDGGSVV